MGAGGLALELGLVFWVIADAIDDYGDACYEQGT